MSRDGFFFGIKSRRKKADKARSLFTINAIWYVQWISGELSIDSRNRSVLVVYIGKPPEWFLAGAQSQYS